MALSAKRHRQQYEVSRPICWLQYSGREMALRSSENASLPTVISAITSQRPGQPCIADSSSGITVLSGSGVRPELRAKRSIKASAKVINGQVRLLSRPDRLEANILGRTYPSANLVTPAAGPAGKCNDDLPSENAVQTARNGPCRCVYSDLRLGYDTPVGITECGFPECSGNELHWPARFCATRMF
jgi:hypothetical protein